MRVQLRQKRLAQGRTSLYLDFYMDGKRRYEFLNLHPPKDRQEKKEMLRLGEELRAKRELVLQSSDHGYVPQFQKHINFIDYFKNIGESKHQTWKTVLLHLNAFTGGDDLPFRKVTPQWIARFEEYLMKRVSVNSTNNYMNKLKAAFNKAMKEGLIQTNPCQAISFVKPQLSERTFLQIEELQQLANTPTNHPEIKRAFLFSCYTGLRLSDVKALTGGKIVNNQIQYRQKKTGGFEYLPLSPMAMKLLDPLPGKEEPIFRLPKSEGGLWTHLQIWVARAGITKHVSFHVARHTFATLAMSNTKDIYLVSKLLGHKDIKHTQIYARIVDDRKREAVSMLPQITL